ncbi:hypothetical protein QYE76_061529 [Lolium multiflorum]|uniref:Serpin domain-containing protein n=1 Tax=Lolium multiflorum TaxID=4521 RepID=A0AAD8S172_LOLMU|nr:hypothetical protein QYE76_061529 [Lolium multiflorum]
MRPKKKARGQATSVDSVGLTALALRLADKLSNGEEHKDQNIMFSPLSIYTALGLLAAGARGTTLDEVLAVLGAASRDEVAGIVRAVAENALAGTDDPSGSLVVTSACGVWCQKDLSLKPSYQQAAVESYKAEARAVDFIRKAEDAREEINSWVAKATKKLITSVLPPGSVHGGTRLVLTNAIYFKGEWEEAFRRSRTKEHRFYRLDGSAVRVPFMAGIRGGDYRVGCHDGFKVLKLPYKQAVNGGGARYSMCFFLPTAREGLPSLIDEMSSSGPGFLFDHLPMRPRSVTKLRLPKFKLSFFCSMKNVLRSLGLQAAFGAGADFSDMVEDSRGDVRLQVEDVFHKAVVEVNEEGTVAAAATVVTMMLECRRPEPPVDFVADHPFAFFIVEELSGAVLFAGHVLDPSTNTE